MLIIQRSDLGFLWEGLIRSTGLSLVLVYTASELFLKIPWLVWLAFLILIAIHAQYSAHIWFKRQSMFWSAYIISTASFLLSRVISNAMLISFPQLNLFVHRELSDADGFLFLAIIALYVFITAIVRINIIWIAIHKSKGKK